MQTSNRFFEPLRRNAGRHNLQEYSRFIQDWPIELDDNFEAERAEDTDR